MRQCPALSLALIESAYNTHAVWKQVTKEDKAQWERVKLLMIEQNLNLYEVGPFIATNFEHERSYIRAAFLRVQYPAIAEECTYLSRYWKLEITKRQPA